MILGGSPIIVAVPPMLLKRTSGIRKGMGSELRTLQSSMVTGAINSMVVTLSKKAERTAVNKQRTMLRTRGRPPEILTALTAAHSNRPTSRQRKGRDTCGGEGLDHDHHTKEKANGGGINEGDDTRQLRSRGSLQA